MPREHGHSPAEIAARIAAPAGRGYLRDVVYGAIDGAVTTFAIVAGVAGAALETKVILALGLANLLADGFSMAAGNYAGTKAERDDASRLARVERRHLAENPAGERAEIREILRRKGLSGDVLEQAATQIAGDTAAAVALMLSDEYGLAPVAPRPLRAALATFAAFVGAGAVPLVPFVLGWGDAFAQATAMTLAVFFTIGAAKSLWSEAPWWRSGLETLAIGGAAAMVAYAVGRLFAP
ncbi:VIT1/CCC1 transporter family protein [Roseicyclus sp.]|uniref:VIT1/CCC1 transporter family protein n=1 Tax=Roseicyclus sp. TaxID=1914329 RepID=UPI003F696F4E